MEETKFYHALKINQERCIGCTHCMTKCPTRAVRIRDGKAVIRKDWCVDCGECLKACPTEAIYVEQDDFQKIFDYECRVALVPTVFIGQFSKYTMEEEIFSALYELGFTHVYQVEFTADMIHREMLRQMELAEEVGSTVKREYCHEVNDEELRKAVHDACYDKAYAIAASGNNNKHERMDAFDAIREEFKAQFSEEELEEKGALIDRYYHDVEKEAMRRSILDEGKRLDGRKTNEIRPIWCEIGYLPGPHGSAVFTRGETQSLSTVTLGTKLDEKIIDNVLEHGKERFLLHYNFPPFSTGEAKAQRGVGRREVGHGHLAWRALKGQIPADYPYVVRVVSDILESNGSSSMATVCAGTLALMDAGVKIKKPVSGIAMGLIKNAGEDKYAVLSDILGDEDHLGDMDFKVTGTKDGITATQMDIKVDGLSYEILEKALLQAKEGREHILGKITECIAEPREDLKPHAPRIETMTIPKEFIGAIIGPGGKIIQGMQEETGATITIEEVDNVGRIEIAGTNKQCIDDAIRMIKAIVAVPEVGEVYKGKVRSIMPYGAFVEFLPGKDGLLHISEIDWKRLETVEEAGIKEGDEIEVKLLDVDPKTGKFKLSRKVLLPKPERQDRPEKK